MPQLQTDHSRLLEDISRDLSGEPSFPTCMDAAILIRDTLKDPETSLEQVARVISIEPLISSKVLRLSNAVAYNPTGKPITELNVAIRRLGFEVVRTLSLAVALDQMLRTSKQPIFVNLAKQAWQHSLQLAAIARTLARRIGGINPDEAMLAGLVSDMGIFYLLYRATSQPDYCAQETLLLSLLQDWHESIGENLLKLLGLPEPVIAAVRLRPAPDEINTPNSLRDVLSIAELLLNSPLPWAMPPDLAHTEVAYQAVQAAYADLLAEASDDIRELHAALAA